MAPTRNLSLIFKSIPTNTPVVGEHLVVEDRPLDISTTEAPKDGLLVQTHYISNDPYLRGRMRPVEQTSYAPAFPLDQPISNSSIVTVLKSNNAEYKEGDLCLIAYAGPFSEYASVPAPLMGAVSKINNPLNLDPKLFLGQLGMPGLTAYSSFYAIGAPKKGETIFVSAASGAVGALVVQLAKREGLTVIGSVGSDEKVKYVTEELGADSCFNYKTETPAAALERLSPKGIDIYYENVGGSHLEAAIDSLNVRGRVVACGMISEYNTPWAEKYPIRNLQRVFEKRLLIRGFIVGDEDMGPSYTKEHQKNVQQWIKEGSLKAQLDVTKGMEHSGEALLKLFNGGNFGKSVLEVSSL